MPNSVGRPPNERKAFYVAEYDLPRDHHGDMRVNQRLLNQLDRCKSDDARRVLLGKGIKYADASPVKLD